MDQLIILKGFHHEQREVHAARPIACQNGITYVTAPHGQTLAFALFQVAPPHDRPAGVAGKDPPAGFYLVIDIHQASQPPDPAADRLLCFEGPWGY